MELLFTPEIGIPILLFCMGILAGLIDAIAGGGGLIAVPSLLFAGVPPVVALGTNRMQACIGELTSFIAYAKYGQFNFSGLIYGVISVAIGAALGTISVSYIPTDFLEFLLPIMMIAIILYVLFSKRLKETEQGRAVLSIKKFMIFVGFAIGFYNGFFGPGTGTFWMISFIALLGYTIKQATINTKPLNLMGNFISLISFAWLGMVNYKFGLIMGAGQILGSIVGSYLVVKDGNRIVRPIFIGVTILITCKVLYDFAVKFL